MNGVNVNEVNELDMAEVKLAEKSPAEVRKEIDRLRHENDVVYAFYTATRARAQAAEVLAALAILSLAAVLIGRLARWW